VPACAVVVEAAVAFEIVNAFMEKFGGDCKQDIKSAFEAYISRVNNY
jgi:chorismate synthase